MLTHISISNYTIVAALEIDFARGMTVITGETGAGKSIMLDALGLCLGLAGLTKYTAVLLVPGVFGVLTVSLGWRWLRGPGPWLAAVFVVPEARKLGVGSALIDHVVSRSRELGYSEIFLYTDHQQKWYEKRGWTYTRDTLLNDMKHVVMRNAL